MQLAKPFAECLGLEEGEQVEVLSHSAPLARSVMVQPMPSSSGLYRIVIRIVEGFIWCFIPTG